MPSNIIQWFPGHMAKTRRIMQECLPDVDLVIEVLDARIPYSSRNPEIKKIVGQKPILTLLNKASLADPVIVKQWCARFRENGAEALPCDCVTGEGMQAIPTAVRRILSDKIERYESRGMVGRRLRAMIVGIPNVGKSSIINRLAGSRRARVENRPGVTVQKQWVSTPIGLDLLDMPGVLWPKFDDRTVGENLAMTGAIKEQVLNVIEIAMLLCGRMRDLYPTEFCTRYKLKAEEIAELELYDLFLLVGRRRGFLILGGEVHEERTATMLLDELQNGKLGRICLEAPKGESNA